MGPAAKRGDRVVGLDTHIVMLPSPGGPVPTPMTLPFNGMLSDKLSRDVLIENQPAAVVGSTADNLPPHLPPGGPFQNQPSNRATVKVGSSSVLINHQKAARQGDKADTCNDPIEMPNGSVVARSSVLVGD